MKFKKINCENVYGNTHISKVRHYKTTLQLVRALKINILFCCYEKMCISKINGLENRAK